MIRENIIGASLKEQAYAERGINYQSFLGRIFFDLLQKQQTGQY